MEIEGGQILYEVRLTVNGHSMDVINDPRASILKTKEEVALDKLPAAVRGALQKKPVRLLAAKAEYALCAPPRWVLRTENLGIEDRQRAAPFKYSHNVVGRGHCHSCSRFERAAADVRS